MANGLRAAIEAQNRKFAEAFLKGDARAVAGCYTENATLLPPDAEMVRGREAIRAFWQAVMNSGVKGAALETLEVHDFGKACQEIGRVTLSIQTPGGGTAKSTAKYAVIWKQEAGDWKVDTDIWNSIPSAK